MADTPEYDDIMAMLNGTYDLNAEYRMGTHPDDIAEGPETWIPYMVQDSMNTANKVLYPEEPTNSPPNLAAVPITPGIRSLQYRGPTRDFYGKELRTGYKYPTTPAGFMEYEDDSDYEIPTSSKNPQRPRTVAAAYNAFNQTLTVMFRDSTFYNYYTVTSNEWEDFKDSYSKGEYILSVLDSKPRGIADVSNFPPEARAEAYEAARSAQLRESSSRGFTPRPTRTRAPRRPSAKPTTEINFGKPGKLIY